MTSLALTVVRSPDALPPPPRRLEGGRLTIGRDPQRSDWVLPDPQKLLSRCHCEVEAVAGGGWQLRDLSSNGTFVNDSAQPLGAGRAVALRDGDRLRLGDYEIDVRIVAAAPPPWPDAPAPFGAAAPAPSFAAAPLPGLDSPFGGDAFPAPVSDHAPAADSAFPLGALRPSASQVPPDWDRSLLLTPAKAPVPAPAAVHAAPPDAASAADPTRPAPLQAAAPMPPASLPPVPGPDSTPLLTAAVAGLRALLVARGLVKREFRIEATVLRPGHNNPLKFAASDEQAVRALLEARDDGVRAVEDAVADLTAHEVAVLEATQAAARALLERLAPAAIEADEDRSALFGAFAERRLWQAYKRRHAQLLAQLDDDFDSAFGTAFARAYEHAIGRGRR